VGTGVAVARQWVISQGAASVILVLALALALAMAMAGWTLFEAWTRAIAAPPLNLWRAYPGAIRGFRETSAGWQFMLSNGIEIAYADGRTLSAEARMDQADLQSVLSQPYPFQRVLLPAPRGEDPGRFRNYELLKAAYGATPDEIKKNLEDVDFGGYRVAFNRNNGAAQALRDVSRALLADPETAGYVAYVAGEKKRRENGGSRRHPNITSWNWRCIAGTQRLSAHSFGIAIDLNKPGTRKPAYWRWLSSRRYPGGLESVREIEPVPWRVVEIFEQHGFIWGGKWHHFDTMHFEYRPEFIRGTAAMPAAEAPRGGRLGDE
jgi:hypothetical protein